MAQRARLSRAAGGIGKAFRIVRGRQLSKKAMERMKEKPSGQISLYTRVSRSWKGYYDPELKEFRLIKYGTTPEGRWDVVSHKIFSKEGVLVKRVDYTKEGTRVTTYERGRKKKEE